jgi:hypothetical protein
MPIRALISCSWRISRTSEGRVSSGSDSDARKPSQTGSRLWWSSRARADRAPGVFDDVLQHQLAPHAGIRARVG